MKMNEALDLINKIPKGFRVRFERAGDGFLRGDCFPEESLLPTEKLAWFWAGELAKAAPGRIVNIYVVDDKNNPLKDYEKREIKNRCPKDK